jgi:hypothetical protein
MKNADDGMQPSAKVPPESVDQIDRKLVEWFALRRGIWSGTAAELLAAVRAGVELSNDLWPQSPRELCAHIASHQPSLHSLGVAVSLSRGHPNMISIRSRQDDQPERKSLSGDSVTNEISSQNISTTQSVSDGDHSEGVCDNTEEALISMLRTSATSELSRPSAISKLAAAPAHLRTAFKKAWMRRPRAM